jgi:dihydroxy-acid dehydratase
MAKKPSTSKRDLRSKAWFDNPDNADMTAIYLERTMNYGLTLEELQSGKPIIGIAQSGSDIAPCNRHHLVLAERVREGIREAGGIAFEFPVHPIQETCKRPTASLDRNLQYLGLVEILYGYPLDGVVLTTGCDKTTPAQIMAAATVDIPAIALSGGPMLNGWFKGQRTGSGTILWTAREMMARGEINAKEMAELVASSAPSAGHCNTMGTASTMNSLAEALGMSLPGCAAIPAPRPAAHRVSDRQAHRRDGARRPEAVGYSDAGGVRECDCCEYGDWRIDECADPSERDCAAYRCRAQQR